MIEHKSVLEPVQRLEKTGAARVNCLQPDGFGQIQPETLRAVIEDGTRLVSIMAANHVIHTLNPLAELAEVCSARGALLQVDGTQCVGKLPMDVQRLGIDALSISAHKMYGPKGAGALYLGPRALKAGILPQMLGGGQEEGLRSGTLNVPAIVGFGAACELAAGRQHADAAHAAELARLLLEGLAKVGGVSLNGHPQQRIPGGIHVTIEGVDSKGLIASVPQVAFSDGSACETDRDPDYILKAIGRPEAAHHSVRMQVGHDTTPTEIEAATRLLAAGIERMRAFAL
jgi:cysteine desulfurase